MRRPPTIAAKRPQPSRKSTTRWQKLYSSRAWRLASEAFRASPEGALCIDCTARGLLVPSAITDHIVEHEGDLTKFWDPRNWAARCWSCHSSRTRRREAERRTGRVHLQKGCDQSGFPTDPRHHWRGETPGDV